MTFEFPEDPETICQTLYNTESTCSRCIGYCDFHKAYVTQKQMKTKQCLQKNCDAFIKNTKNRLKTQTLFQPHFTNCSLGPAAIKMM